MGFPAVGSHRGDPVQAECKGEGQEGADETCLRLNFSSGMALAFPADRTATVEFPSPVRVGDPTSTTRRATILVVGLAWADPGEDRAERGGALVPGGRCRGEMGR